MSCAIFLFFFIASRHYAIIAHFLKKNKTLLTCFSSASIISCALSIVSLILRSHSALLACGCVLYVVNLLLPWFHQADGART